MANDGNTGHQVGMRRIRVEMIGMQGIRVGMWGMGGIRVERM